MAINTKTSLFNYNGYITTQSGIEVYLPRPTVEMIKIEDIAKALSNIARWNGQTKTPFTVAQHCVMVCWMVEDHQKKPALLHDAVEAYIGDMSRPLKELVPAYKAIEHQFQMVIADKFGYHALELEAIKEADKQMQKIEWEYLFENNPTGMVKFLFDHSEMHLPDIWNHQQSEIMFLLEFKKWFNHL